MSKKPTNNIDDVFRSSIENMETQPSDQFWLKASEDALFRSSQTNRKIIGKWKMIAAAMAIALVSLSAYVMYMQSEISRLNNKLNLKEEQHNSTIVAQNKISQTSTIIQPPVKEVEENIQPKTVVSVAVIHKHSNTKKNKRNNVAIKDGGTMSEAQVAKDLKDHSTSVTYSQTVSTVETAVSNNNSEQNTNSNSDKSLALISAANDVTIPQNDISNPAIDYANDEKGVTKNTHSKFSVSVFYEFGISDELLENEASDNVVVNNSVVSSEEEVNPYKVGARVGYDISPRLSFVTGALFYNFKISFQPTTIIAQKLSNGEVGYSFQTSAGAVNCPYDNPKLGDALVVKGTYTTNYISVPLYIKYVLLKRTNWNLYITGGVDINIVAYRQMNMHWQDLKWESGNTSEGMSDAAKTYYSAYFSPGITYRLFKQFSIYAEPSLQGPPTLISKKGIAPASSIYTGFATGIIYQL
ncbi:MAG TPA: outer membrane beta-barrel protein [Bacteroidia bacterium]|nr:outer membrane beta-barrel protein [Bacteroidia bacterium]